MSSENDNPILKNYKIKKVIGKGTFSVVKLAKDKATGEKIAIKILEKDKIKNKRDMNRIERELSMVKKIDHPNIAKVYEVKEDEKKYYIIMEYCDNGELFNLILEKHRLSEEESAYYYFQIINGLEYIHLNNIIHRDLKPENLLLTKNNILKIIDFGLSNYNTDDNLLSTPCGSPCYASPEMVSGEKYNGFTSDIWSTGIILYAMIYGYLPFENINNNNDLLFQKISECKVDYPRNSSIFALDLLKKILVADSNERIKIDNIKKHKFYKKGKIIFYHKHKESNLYQNIELDKTVNLSVNNTINKENNSIEKNNYIKINSVDKNKNNKKIIIKIENSKENDNLDDNENKRFYNSNKNRYKNKGKIDINKNILNESTKIISSKKLFNSSHKCPKEERKQRIVNIGDKYFENINMNENMGTIYYINKNNETEINKVKNNTINSKKNDFVLSSPTKADKAKNNESIKLKEEKKDEKKDESITKKKHPDKRKDKILSKSITINTKINDKKLLNIEIMPATVQNKNSELKKHKKIEFSEKKQDLNSFTVERDNGYYYKALSKIAKTPHLNPNNKKNIVINLTNDQNIDNNKVGKKGIDNKNEQNVNVVNNTENNLNKKKISKHNRNKNLEKDKDYLIGDKKFSTSIQRNRIIERKSHLLPKNRPTKNIEEKEEELKNETNISPDNTDRSKHKDIKKTGINDYTKYNTNLKVKEPTKIPVNYKVNNSFIITTQSKRGINLEFLNKNQLNKDIVLNSNSFCNDLKQSEKNYSFLNNNQTNEARFVYKIDPMNIKNHNHNNKKGIRNHKNDFISNDIKIEVNDSLIYSNNNKNNKLHTINKSSLGEHYMKRKDEFKKISNNKDKNENNIDKNDNNIETNNKNVELKNRNTNHNFNNNHIKIISNSKKDISSKKYRKKLSSSAYNDPYFSPTFKNKDLLINMRKIKQDKKKKLLEQENQENEEIIKGKDKDKEIEKNKCYKDKRDNLSLTINKINNKISDSYITRLNNTNKIFNSNDFKKDYNVRNDINEKEKDFNKTERRDKAVNHQTYTYIHKNINDDISNKCINEGKQSISYKTKILNGIKKSNECNEDKNNNCEKENNDDKNRNKWSTNIINKINISNFPSITIDMNILNKNNKKYLKLYDAIKNKL